MTSELSIATDLKELGFKGDIFTDLTHKILYATDASAYREMPLGLVVPRDDDDVRMLVKWAYKKAVPLIPRAAGTSLAGQVVGNGLVVDFSKHFTRIKEINIEKGYAVVQPGVVRDDLNLILKKQGFFFSPETSTANRCNIGGMLGNNSCGAHSLVYGSTREHTFEVKGFLADGSKIHIKPLNKEAFQKKTKGVRLENKIYKHIADLLSNPEVQQEIQSQFPNPKNKRRNTGYALDLLLESSPFQDTPIPFNFSKLIAGSEGTLMLVTEIKLKLTPLPPPCKSLVCIHLNSIREAVRANLIALKYAPSAIELMDKPIMDLAKENKTQNENRFFIKGDPQAMLMVELDKRSFEEADALIADMEQEMRAAGLGYHFPVVRGADIAKVWQVRKAGLGLLANMKGDAKPAPVIEDTAILPEHLEDYLEEFAEILKQHNLSCVYYAHIATGEIHLRPVLNLKKASDRALFKTIAQEVAVLVKKYDGSLSGEHGDGRLRGEFIPLMFGDKVYRMFEDLKQVWDSKHILNPNKIVHTPPMNEFLRYDEDWVDKQIDTIFDFSASGGYMGMVEKCNGSGDCRKSHLMKGTMCPSYQASKNESQTTRARANILRELISKSRTENPFEQKEIYQILDLCLSCKACKSECPSNIDMTKLKAEFMQHYYDVKGVPLRTWLIANISKMNRLAMITRGLSNFVMQNKWTSFVMKKTLGFATQRSLPALSSPTLNSYFKRHRKKSIAQFHSKVYLFNDEFTNYNDAHIGVQALHLLNRLGYEVIIPKHLESGRAYMSKGLLRKAQYLAEQNVLCLKDLISEETPLIGIEPSAILSFRDEYPDLLTDDLKASAEQIKKHTFMFDEFLAREIDKGMISENAFTDEAQHIKVHGHCQQKAVASTQATLKILSFPKHYTVEEISSGCCGMAGSFGYEKEHYDLSMKIGEMVLFPEVRKTASEVLISAPGTSCRHQIKDGTNREVLHPISILYQALV